ncbi:SMC family ATPase [Sphaerisporangium album]|uniref:Nuclease SbcCD subunit C n=1 Tax=Sphaerisporangium album TaxID=509200 RepID=A0A367FG96_9ACTN|nr:AAA family ATPase [Sphaerisporangium album]RCG29413.1 SMC family ATPase [Sphaerisporangium album]
MRLHRLRLTAFGSFPGSEEVDFDALGEAGLFLVHGPTGAGKTTVLDAVCYALYGQVPGLRNNARRLRCDHAPADRGPEVTLEVTLRGRRLRVTRSPVWDRPKLRGEGVIEEKAKVRVWELPPSGEPVFHTNRADEAGEFIGGLLGMNADQFCQVAMLPQGDFARFLRADGDERRKLLEKLFSVKIYSEVEHWLADHRTAAWQERQELRARVDSVLDQMRGAAGPALLAAPSGDDARSGQGELGERSALGARGGREAGGPDVRADHDPQDKPLEWARDLLAAAERVWAAYAGERAAGEHVLKSARAELEAGRELARRRRAHADAQARRDELDRAAEERSDLETILAEAARADRVAPLLQQAEQRAEAAAKARRLAADATARALPLLPESERPSARSGADGPIEGDSAWSRSGVPPQWPDSGEPWEGDSTGADPEGLSGRLSAWPDPERLSELERVRRDEVARLEQLVPEESRLARLYDELAGAGRRLEGLAREEAETDRRLAVLPELRRDTGERLALARLATSGLPTARAAVSATARHLDAVRRREELAAEVATAHDRFVTALSRLPAALTGGLPVAAPAPDDRGTVAGPLGASPPDDGGIGLPAAVAGGLAVDMREVARAVRERLAEWERDHRDELAGLEHRRAEEARFADVRAELADADERLAGLAEREAALAGAQAELPATLARMDERLAAVRRRAALIPAAENAFNAACALLEHAERRDALVAELEAAEAERRAATDEAQELRDRLQSIRQARIEGMAAELAHGLVPGEPCVVCGSTDHPEPALAAESMPTVDDELEAEARADAAQDARQAAEGRVAVLSSQLDEAEARAEGYSVGEALAAREEAEGELAALAVAAEEADELAERAQGVREALGDAQAKVRDLDLLAAEQRTHRAALQAELDRLTAVLDTARGADASVAARRDRVGEEARLLGLAIEAAASLGEAATVHEEAGAAVRRDVPEVLRLLDAAETAAREATAPPGVTPAPEPGSREHVTAAPDVTPDLGPRGSGVDGPDDGERDGGREADGATLEGAGRIAVRAEEALGRLREAGDAETELAEAAARIDAELAELNERLARTGVELAAERVKQGGLTAESERLAERLGAARGEDATLAARLDRLADEAELLRDAAEVGRHARSAAAEREAAVARAESAAAEAGFAGVEDARAATRTPAARQGMAERLRALDAEHTAVAKLLADPQLAEAAARPAPDLPALTEAFERAEREHGERVSACDQAAARRDRLAALAGDLEDTMARWRPAEDRHKLAKGLAELAVGTSSDNVPHMRLSSYVLGERLRQVVAAANTRLDHMSGGRYVLLYDPRKAAGDRKRAGGGLGLRVLDGWTGVDRDPATLSGGEAFMTSLALALALADVVTAEAGGVELGTLFIDEGFGSLDEDTLDGVLDILDELRDGGRAVGIVSHVGELRARVPAQLRVVKNRFGSRLSLAVPG